MISLGIDCGTQSTKTIALDGKSGEILATATQTYGLLPSLPPGHLEQNPQDWIEALESTVTSVLQQLGERRREVAAIGISGQQHGFVPLDAQSRVIRPAKLWCDTSTVKQCDEIRAHFGGKAPLVELIGNDMLPGFTAPKILWLKQNEPENFKKLDQVLLPHDYLNFYLTGQISMEFGDASGTALLDVKNRSWSMDLCNFIDPSLLSKLPPLQSSQEKSGVLKTELLQKWGLQNTVIISAGGGDNMMGAIGTGNIRDGVVTASLGTSGTIYAFSSKPVIDPEGEIAAFCDSTGGWLPLLCTMNVTVATEAIIKMFDWKHEDLSQAIESIPPGADGLIFLPFLQGERTPNLPHGTGTFHGLNLSNMTRGNMARATMEGVTLGMAYGLRRMRSLGIVPQEIRLTGGGSKSAVWRQICADIFECPVVALKSAEGAALGAAIQSLSLCVNQPIAELCAKLIQVDESTRARPLHTAAYEGRLDQMMALVEKIYRS